MSTSHGAVAVLRGWEGNRRCGLTPAMYQTDTSTYGQNSIQTGDEHPSYTPVSGWSKKRRHDGTDDGTPVGRYAMGHCTVIVNVRRTHDGTLARGVVQATGHTTRHV